MRAQVWPTWLLCLFVGSHVGCGGCEGDAVPSGLLEKVPEGAKAVVVIDLAAAAESIRGFTPFASHSGRWNDLAEDVDAYLTQAFGVSVLGARRAVAWGDDDEQFTAYVEGDFDGELRGSQERIGGQPALELEAGTYLVQHEGSFLVGTRPGIERTIAVVEGSVPSLQASEQEDSQALRDLLGSVGGGTVVVAVLGGEVAAMVEEFAPGLRGAAASFSPTSVQARARLNDSDAASTLATQLQVGLTMGIQMLEQQVAEVGEGGVEPPEALQAILGLHAARLLADEMLDIDSDGSDLVATADISDVGGGIAIVGVLASVAVPAFLKYIKRSKTTEATMNLRRLYDSAISYYDTDRADRAGNILPPQFPASVPRTPAVVPCGNKAPVQQSDWANPTWAALNFALTDPHYYSYQFDSSGQGEGASFTATAFGDLDCDGLLSTFVRVGEVSGGEVYGGAGLYQQNELE